MQVVVTMIDNVVLDEEGRFVYTDDGGIELKNPENVGILLKTHVVSVQQTEDGILKSGLSPLAEVIWNEIRTPAPCLVSPNDLVWVSITDDAEDDVTDNEYVDDDIEIEEIQAN